MLRVELQSALQLPISRGPIGHFEVALSNLVVNLGGLWIDLKSATISQQGLRQFSFGNVVVSVSHKLLFSCVGVPDASRQDQADLQQDRKWECRSVQNGK